MAMIEQSDDETSAARSPRRGRRLSDMILVAFHMACDRDDFEVANQLLAILEIVVQRPPPEGRAERRRERDSLVAAYERLWSLRHPDPERLAIAPHTPGPWLGAR